MLATILAASIVVMALPLESAEASRDRGEVEMQWQAILNLMVMVMKVISQKVVMLLVAQQAAQIHLHQSNKNTGYLDVWPEETLISFLFLFYFLLYLIIICNYYSKVKLTDLYFISLHIFMVLRIRIRANVRSTIRRALHFHLIYNYAILMHNLLPKVL